MRTPPAPKPHSKARLPLRLVALAAPLLVACAPPMGFRPAMPMLPGQHNEVGAGVSLGGELFPHEGRTHEIGLGGAVGGGGQAWFYHQFARFFDLGGIAWASTYNQAGAGLSLRFRIVNTEPFVLGFEVTGGIAFAEGAFPLAARLSDRVWLYMAPGAGIVAGGNAVAALPVARIPLGLSIRVSDHWLLMAEAQPQIFFFTQTIVTGGFGFAYRF